METLQTFLSILGLTAFPLLMGSNSCFAEGHCIPPLDEDCSYLDNLFGLILDEELMNQSLGGFALALGGSDH